MDRGAVRVVMALAVAMTGPVAMTLVKLAEVKQVIDIFVKIPHCGGASRNIAQNHGDGMLFC